MMSVEGSNLPNQLVLRNCPCCNGEGLIINNVTPGSPQLEPKTDRLIPLSVALSLLMYLKDNFEELLLKSKVCSWLVQI